MDPKEMAAEMQKLGESWKAYRETNDSRLAALEKGQPVAELSAKLARIEADVSDAQARINRINLAAHAPASGGQPSEMVDELRKFMRSNGQTGNFKGSVNVTTNADGGYVSIPEIETMMERVASANVAMRRLASVRNIGRNSLILNVNKSGVVGGWVAENSARSGQTGTPALAQVEVFARDEYANPQATQDALDDINFDVAAWLAEEAAISFGEIEETAFITGNGVGQPKGILAYTMIANASYEWLKVGYVTTGTSGGGLTGDKLITLIHTLKTKYRQNGTFLLNDLTLSTIRALKDGQNNYLWQPSFMLGQPDKLGGYPVQVSDAMPDIGADSYSIAFGDFKSAYQIVDRKGLSVLRDPYSAKGFVSFYTTKRCGGEIKNFEALKVMKFGTS